MRGAAEDPSARRERPQPRLAELGRSATGPLILAVTTIAALAGAVLALLPTLGRGRPVGRFGPRPAGDAAGDDRATTDPLTP